MSAEGALAPAAARPPIAAGLRLPVIAAPMFLVSNPDLVLAQCRAGVVGSFPSLNARPVAELHVWIERIEAGLAAARASGEAPAPYAVNLIVHRSNDRLAADLDACVAHRVPIVITSLGARPEVNAAIHGYGGVVLHDVINQEHARKAVDKGADGLILVAAGAGGHAGRQSPFALVAETRAWFDGPIALSGAIATGAGVLAARAMGADYAYVGSPFIACDEAAAGDAYKDAIVAGSAADIVYTDRVTGVYGNYLRESLRAAGFDPEALESTPARGMDFAAGGSEAKAWKDIWGCGQGIGAVRARGPTRDFIDRLVHEYQAARRRLWTDCAG